jgi:cytochrome c
MFRVKKKSYLMIEHKFTTHFSGVLLLAASAILLGGCGKKEAPQQPSSPVASLSRAPMPKEPEAALPAASGAATTASPAEVAMRKSDCFTCHAVDKKIVGPAYSWIAYRYKGDKEAASRLVDKVRKGGMGQWNAYTGGVVMTPHPQLSDDAVKTMVEWVLSQVPAEPPKV